MQGRGLKHGSQGQRGTGQPVAPHAGAWIETIWFSICLVIFPVAPHAGAWIETISKRRINDRHHGRPSCRGVD